MNIKVKDVTDIVFSVQSNDKLEFNEYKSISFHVDEKLYATKIPENMISDIFGKLNLKSLTDRELVIGCILSTIAQERRK